MRSVALPLALLLTAAAPAGRAGSAAAAANTDKDSFWFPPPDIPRMYRGGDVVPLDVDILTSMHTQQSRGYYENSSFCEPLNGIRNRRRDGSTAPTRSFTGVHNSPYELYALQPETCAIVCQRRLEWKHADRLRYHIKYGYHHNWIIDHNLPSAAIGVGPHGEMRQRYAGGFPIGFMRDKMPYIHNHVNIYVDYYVVEHNNGDDGVHIVGFAVEPLSVKHDGNFTETMQEPHQPRLKTCQSIQDVEGEHMSRDIIRQNQVVRPGETILYTYDVIWRRSPVPYHKRWEVYLTEGHLVPAQVHWYSISNSMLVVLILAIVVVVKVRQRNRPCCSSSILACCNPTYTVVAGSDDCDDPTGATTGRATKTTVDSTIRSGDWKQLHADVFRPPPRLLLFCVLVGTGVQLAVTAGIVLVLGSVGVVTAQRPGSLLLAIVVVYAYCGIVGGYVSVGLHRAWYDGKHQVHKKVAVWTAVLFPSLVVVMLAMYTILLALSHSSPSAATGAALGSAMGLLSKAYVYNFPLVHVGAAGAAARCIITPFPTDITTTTTPPIMPRAIPMPRLTCSPRLACCLAGLAAFGCLHVELFFAMAALWMYQLYSMYGYMLIVYVLLLITCAETTVLFVFAQLRAENHRWCWFSLMCSGSVAVYVWLYSIYWYPTLDAAPFLITRVCYFGSQLLLCLAIFLACGSVGVLTSLHFIRKLYKSVDSD